MTVALTACIASTSAGVAASEYTPGLGEFMAATQMRHIKLWFAGQARNWRLAAYELDEIQEGFEDIVKYQPVHEGSPLPIKDILPKLTAAPLARLHAAISSEDKVHFEEAFDSLTAACNACHQAERYGFNVITRPRSNPYTNQDFSSSYLVPSTDNQKPDTQPERKNQQK